MKTTLLREFLVLSKHLNFSRAAEQLNMTQPVLSRHIKYLEDYFDAQFLKRNTHKVELTAVGQLFAEEARKILSQYETSLAVIRNSLGRGQRSLSIVFLGEATRSFLASFLGEFSACHPEISIEYCDIELDAVPDAFDRQACDLAFFIRPHKGRRHEGLRHIHLFKDPLCIAVNKRHPLAQRSVVSIRELGDWPVLGPSRQSSPLAWECCSSFLEHYGIAFTLAKEGSNLETNCFNVEFNERAIVLLPKHRRNLLGDNSVLVEVAEEDCYFNVELVWHVDNMNPNREVFLKEFAEFSGGLKWQPRSERPLAESNHESGMVLPVLDAIKQRDAVMVR
ncbi:LysR family transcriptional regulator [Telmatospirillum siberiense]|uniref:LysR family transcriptional regulator n=1 Tax=Telmatospirillum siberiense TaxID=382514 RepID=A0A2N3Q0D0_9PROT|nr:LysR family transcriptional regulator [Telmatospirillum siberiense]PKU26117.1 LysR family transcriptional regulator [Telmatospirillum siberiense]